MVWWRGHVFCASMVMADAPWCVGGAIGAAVAAVVRAALGLVVGAGAFGGGSIVAAIESRDGLARAAGSLRIDGGLD